MNDVSDESLMSINLFHGSAGGLLAFLVCVTFILYFIIIPRNRSSVNNCHMSLMAFGLKNFSASSLGAPLGTKIMKRIRLIKHVSLFKCSVN